MEPPSVHDHHLRLCHHLDTFYGAYAEVLLVDEASAGLAARRARLFAAFTAAIHITHAF